MFRLGCAAILVLMFAIPAIAAHYLPWWGVLLVLIAEVFFLLKAGPALIKYGFKRLFLRLFLTKSRVLKGATVQVHEVSLTTRPVRRRRLDEPTESPDQQRTEVTAADGTIITTPVADPESQATDDQEDAYTDDDADSEEETDSKNARFVLVDFTLTPSPGQSRMQHYDPAELLLVPIDAKISLTEDPTSDGVSASAHDLTLIDDAGAQIKDFDKLTGPSHLRITFQCPQALQGRVKFRYYFEAFGDLTLPENAEC
jgi:hypothetical protein